MVWSPSIRIMPVLYTWLNLLVTLVVLIFFNCLFSSTLILFDHKFSMLYGIYYSRLSMSCWLDAKCFLFSMTSSISAIHTFYMSSIFLRSPISVSVALLLNFFIAIRFDVILSVSLIKGTVFLILYYDQMKNHSTGICLCNIICSRLNF